MRTNLKVSAPQAAKGAAYKTGALNRSANLPWIPDHCGECRAGDDELGHCDFQWPLVLDTEPILAGMMAP